MSTGCGITRLRCRPHTASRQCETSGCSAMDLSQASSPVSCAICHHPTGLYTAKQVPRPSRSNFNLVGQVMDGRQINCVAFLSSLHGTSLHRSPPNRTGRSPQSHLVLCAVQYDGAARHRSLAASHQSAQDTLAATVVEVRGSSRVIMRRPRVIKQPPLSKAVSWSE